MAEYLVQDTTLTAIADAVRAKKGTTEPIALTDFAAEIESIETSQVETNKISVGDELGALYFNTNITPDLSSIKVDETTGVFWLIDCDIAQFGSGYGVRVVDYSIYLGTNYSGFGIEVLGWNDSHSFSEIVYSSTQISNRHPEILIGWQNLGVNGEILFGKYYHPIVVSINLQEDWESYIGKIIFGGVSRISLAVCDFGSEVPFSVNEEELKGAIALRDYAFYRSPIQSISLPSTITQLGVSALSGCDNLTEITLPEGLETIKGSAISDCDSLKKITIPSTLKKCYARALYSYSIKEVYYNGTMSDWCKISLGGEYGPLRSAESITMGGELLDLNDLHVSGDVGSINYYSFSGWGNLTKVTIEEGVTQLRQHAFYSNSKLTYITIPASVTSIEWRSLYCGSSSNKCTYVFKGTTPPEQTSGSLALSTSYIDKIIVPAGCGETYKTATNWSNFASYIEEATE